ncbi:ALP1-like protein [Tanacetum coccineum]
MNQNDNDEERHFTVFDIDEETDIYFYDQAYAYDEQLQEENRPRLTWNPIHRDRERAEERLMGDYFDDHCANNDINVLDNSSLFDDLLDDKASLAPYVVKMAHTSKVAIDFQLIVILLDAHTEVEAGISVK